MDLAARVIALFSTFGGVFSLISILTKRKTRARHPFMAEIRPSKNLPFISLLCFLSAVLWTWRFLHSFPIWAFVFPSCLICLLGYSILLGYFDWHIAYNQKEIELQTVFRKRHIYKMSDVQGITPRKNVFLLHFSDGRVVRVRTSSGNGSELIKAIEKYDRIEFGWVNVPYLPGIPEKLFNGYLRCPGDFIIVGILVDLLVVGAGIAAVALTAVGYFRLESPQVVSISGAYSEIHEDILYVTDHAFSNSEYYCIGIDLVIKPENYEEYLAAIHAQQPLCMEIQRRTVGSGTYITAIYDEHGATLLSREEAQRGRYRELHKCSIIAGICIGGVLLFSIAFCLVVRNAPRFPRLVRIFVRKEYLNL